MRRHQVSGRGPVVMVGAALIVALVSATTVANASTKFDYTTSIDNTGELVVVFDEGSLKRFDGVAYRLEAFGEMVTPKRRRERPRHPPARVVASSFSAPCGCSGGRYFEFTMVVLTNLATGHVYRLDPIRRDM